MSFTRVAFALLFAACATAPRAPAPPPRAVLSPPPAPDPPPAALLDALAGGDAAFRAGRWAEAADHYQRALALRGEPALTLHHQIGIARLNHGDHAGALRHLQEVLDADAGNAAIRAHMARAAIASGAIDRATELLRGLRGTPAPPDLFFDVGAHFVNANEPGHAIVYFTEALLRDPRFVEAYFRRAMACLQLGRHAEAKRDLRIVTELAPGTAQAESARQALARLR